MLRLVVLEKSRLEIFNWTELKPYFTALPGRSYLDGGSKRNCLADALTGWSDSKDDKSHFNTRTYRYPRVNSAEPHSITIFTVSAASSQTPTPTPLLRAPQAAAMALRRHETCGARKRAATARSFQPVSLPLHGA